MARRYLVVPQIGAVILTKRRGSRSIRLSINTTGQVRVGMPTWTPYEAGLLFVKKHQEWIQRQLLVHAPKQLISDSRIGKRHQLAFINRPAKDGLAEIRLSPTRIKVKTSLNPADPLVQKKVLKACERALKQEAETLLPKRVAFISRKYDLPYANLKIRKLTSRWGSCSSKKDITLNYFLIQLPWELIDYVILHELAHTVFRNHSSDFWGYMKKKVPDLSDLRKEIKVHKPRIEPH